MVKKTTCPRKYNNAQSLLFEKKYKYWSARETYTKGKVVQKGFDLTSVNAKRWEEFKKKYGIKLLKKATPPARNKTHVFMSKDCVTIVTGSHSNENGNKYLGYMRFEAPLSHEEDLHKMLEDFSHITTFVKEEGSYAYPPKSYAGFI